MSLTRKGLVHVSPESFEYINQTSSSPSPPDRVLVHVIATMRPVGSAAAPTMGCWRGLQVKQKVPMFESRSLGLS